MTVVGLVIGTQSQFQKIYKISWFTLLKDEFQESTKKLAYFELEH